MKRYILTFVTLIATVVLSGCTGAGASGYGDGGSGYSTELTRADIMNLDDGYTIEGSSSYGNGVVLRFYHGRYEYERVDEYGAVRESFSGYFALQNGAIKIYFGDDDGGGYAIETHNGFLEEGYYYDIIGVRDDITIESVYRSGAF